MRDRFGAGELRFALMWLLLAIEIPVQERGLHRDTWDNTTDRNGAVTQAVPRVRRILANRRCSPVETARRTVGSWQAS